MMDIREYLSADAAALAELCRASARVLAAPHYTPEQIAAWSRFPENLAEFSARLARGYSLVVREAGTFAAFGQLEPIDHIALLYTGPRFARRGHATTIYRRLEAKARAHGVRRVHTTASLLSRPLFEREGFTLTEVEHTCYHGVEFERFKMQKELQSDG